MLFKKVHNYKYEIHGHKLKYITKEIDSSNI
jgi:hypothetical protein